MRRLTATVFLLALLTTGCAAFQDASNAFIDRVQRDALTPDEIADTDPGQLTVDDIANTVLGGTPEALTALAGALLYGGLWRPLRRRSEQKRAERQRLGLDNPPSPNPPPTT